MHIQWFPGHMTKSLRMMEESVKVVDAIGYVLDCRAPFSCFNPAFGQYTEKKPCVFLLNKSDLADEKTTDRWLAYFASKGDKPGVTRGKQWIRLGDGLELLDTPGTLWSRFENQCVAQNLFFIGSISDNVVDLCEGGQALLDRLTEVAPDALKNRYKLTDGDLRDEGLMDKICIKRGCLNKGEPDRERCAAAIIDDFRKGRMGRVSLEAPQAEDEA